MALLALCGAASWGAGDFLGGLASRRAPVLVVLAVSQALGLVGVALWVLLSGDPFPGVADLAPAVGAGAAGLLGLGALYRGFAVGAMGIVAPISAASPIVPLAVDAAGGTMPSALQAVGIVLVLGGVAAVSLAPSAPGSSRIAAGAGLAALAALGFGLFVVGIGAGAEHGAAWTVVAARFTSATLAIAVVLATSTSLGEARPVLPQLVAVAAFDTGANVLVAVATTQGPVGIVAVLSALYPIVTIVLARLLLGERLSASRRIGGAVAIVGAALVAAG
jgi:drug/metabolite transporter (DMT)-like permease